jgi:sugar lactone lactonase YvrE
MNTPYVRPTLGFVPTVWGQPVYTNGTTKPIGNINFGADGITLSADGSTLYFSTTGGRELYSIATSLLRDDGPYSELIAQSSVKYHGQKGLSDGFESDSNDAIYMGNIEANSISIFDSTTGTFSTFVRDPRFSWTDTMSVAADGYLYFTENQLWRLPSYHGGVDLRVKPYVLFKVKLPNGGTKIQQAAPGGNGTQQAAPGGSGTQQGASGSNGAVTQISDGQPQAPTST